MVSYSVNALIYLFLFFLDTHEMGQPLKAKSLIEEYIGWRMGEGWVVGTIVQVMVGEEKITTQITKIVNPIVWVRWGFGAIKRHVAQVLPLLEAETIDLNHWSAISEPTPDPVTPASEPQLKPVFVPTATLPQEVVTDWLAGCVEMMDRRRESMAAAGQEKAQRGERPEKVVKTSEVGPSFSSSSISNLHPSDPPVPVYSPDCHILHISSPQSTPDLTRTKSPKEFLSYSQTPHGSQTLQGILNSDDQATKESIVQSVMSSDLMEMVVSPLSCQVVLKLCSCLEPDKLEQLVLFISKYFPSLSLHPFGHQAVLAVLALASQEQRNMITSQLESENTLLELLMDKQGYFVVLRCLPYLQSGTLSSIVTSLECRVVEVGCHPQASSFLQEFFRLFNGKDRMDMLLEKVMDSMQCLAYSETGHWVVQTVIELGHPSVITRATNWFESNMQKMLEDCTAVLVARTLVQQLLAHSRRGVENNWSLAMDRLVDKMTDTMVVLNGNKLPLIIVAAMHHVGHILVLEVVRKKDFLGHSRVKMEQVMEQHRKCLTVDMYGCLVVKGLEGWM